MAQQAKRSSWVKPSEYEDNWGFDRPDPNLVKVSIGLRSESSQATCDPPPVIGRSRMTLFLDEYERKRNLQTEGQTTGETYVPKLMRKETPQPSSPHHAAAMHLFETKHIEARTSSSLFSPTSDNTSPKQWQTSYTRASGEIITANHPELPPLPLPLPFNTTQIVKSTAAMSSSSQTPSTTQTAIWIGPRLLLSTLRIHHWIRGHHPTHEECDLLRRLGKTFNVEREISSRVLSAALSPRVQLVDFSVEYDIGVFKMQDEYPPNAEYVSLEWLLEIDEVYGRDLEPGRGVGCVGYSGEINGDAVGMRDEDMVLSYKRKSQSVFWAGLLNQDVASKHSMKCFAPGILDYTQQVHEKPPLFRVRSSLWSGSSGGPCILLDGFEGGGIIGLVQGYEPSPDPHNIVNGFPNGLKKFLRSL